MTPAASLRHRSGQRFSKLMGLLTAFSVLVLPGCGPRDPGEALVLITIDTLRADRLGCGGDAYARTPHLDRLARTGTQWARAVSPVPLTLPAHTTILSGRAPTEHGVRDNGHYRVPDDVPLVAEELAREGYRTAAFLGAYPVAARFGLARGFDDYHDVAGVREEGAASSFVERAAHHVNADLEAWLVAHRENAGRAFLWVHYFDPHAPYQPPRVWRRASGRDPYRGEVAFTDDRAGRLLARLAEAYGSLRVVITSDHGEALGEHGEETHGVFVYEATTRVPLLAAGAGFPAGRLVSRPAALEQIASTLLLAAGIRPEQRGFEVPALPGLEEFEGTGDARDGGKFDGEEEPMYVESLYARLRHGWSPLRALRTDRWKVIDAPRPEIYDLHADPGERNDLAADGGAPADARALLESLSESPFTWAPPGGEIDPEVDEALASLGYITPRRDVVEEGALPDPKDRVAMERLLGIAGGLLEAGNVAGAERALREASALEPQNKEAAVLRARTRAAEGRLDEARSLLEACLAWPPASLNAVVHSAAGRIELDAGQPDAAEPHFAAAVALDPLDVDARYHHGLAAYRLGRWGDAADRWKETLRLDPGHARARRWLPDAEKRRIEEGER